MPLRNVKEARAVLDRLRAEGDRFGGLLRALEAHPGYRRLRTQHTSGATLLAWEETRATTDELSARLRAYRSTLDRAGALLGTKARLGRDELATLNDLLQGPVDLPTAPPEDLRDLSTLLARMAAGHTEVLRTVTDVDDYSTTLSQRLNQLGEALRVLRTRVASLAFTHDGAASLVDGLARELAEVTPTVLADPLGCVRAGEGSDDQATVDGAPLARLRRLSAAVDNAHAYLASLRGQQSDLTRSIARLRTRVAEIGAVEQDCRRAESEVRARIAEPVLDSPEDAVPDLRQRLGLLDRRRMEGQWPQLEALIREMEQGCAAASERAGHRRAAAQGLLDRRDELRGRLESYRAMAIKTGYAEDLDLAEEYERTYQILWSAPCDLSQAAAAVERYQTAVIDRTEPGVANASSGSRSPGRTTGREGPPGGEGTG